MGATSTSGKLTDSSPLDVHQSFSGGALDAEGDAAWAVSAEYDAHLEASGGSLRLSFYMGAGNSRTQYVMTATSPQVNGVAGKDNPVSYVFSGTYQEAGANGSDSPIPLQGSAVFQLSVWGDGISITNATFHASR